MHLLDFVFTHHQKNHTQTILYPVSNCPNKENESYLEC